MNTAEYIVKKLEELGVNDFFGLPGDYNFNIIYAVQNNSNTRWVGCTNELNAGYAADGYARMRGYGAVVTTYGVGELSAINALAGSFAENVPVVSIVGVPSTKTIANKELTHHNFQDVNFYTFAETYKSVTAATAFLTRDNAKLEIDRVLKILVKEKKPIYIAIPSDIAIMDITDRSVSYEWNSNKENLQEAARLISDKINKSKRPVILGDVLIKRFDAKLEYKEFVEKLGVPTTNFIMGSNLVSTSYENYVGGYYGNIRNPIAQKYVEDSDCLISVGTIYTDLNSVGFNLKQKINKNIAIYGTYVYIDGKKINNIKMSDVLTEVTKLVNKKDLKADKPNIGYKHKYPENEPLTSDYIYSRLQEFFKDNDIIISETGIVPHGISQTKFPDNADIEYQLLWASIGWATPATLGVCLAKPNSRIILVTGEGAHQITLMEIGNMLRLGIKPVVIVINNDGYTIERVLSNDENNEFNNIVKINYAKLARAFDGDIWATKVTTAEDFDKALKVTQIMNKMCYIELCTDKMDMPSITKDLMVEMRKRNKDTKPKAISSINPDRKSFEEVEISPYSSGLDYETVVHKVYPINTSNDNSEEEK